MAFDFINPLTEASQQRPEFWIRGRAGIRGRSSVRFIPQYYLVPGFYAVKKAVPGKVSRSDFFIRLGYRDGSHKLVLAVGKTYAVVFDGQGAFFYNVVDVFRLDPIGPAFVDKGLAGFP